MHTREIWVLTAGAVACAVAGALLTWRGMCPAGALLFGGAIALVALLAARLGRALYRKSVELSRLQQALRDERAAAARAVEAARAQAEREYQDEMEQLRSGLTHSLRVPLSIIQGYADLLRGELIMDEDTRRSYLDKIVQRSQYASAVLGQQISLARSEDELTLSCEPVDLLALVRQAALDFQASANLRGISIQVLSAQSQAAVEADHCQLTKVFFNLLENAVKYMGREGMVTIWVTELGGQVRVIVKDDGLGLDPEETLRIFELNYQGSNRLGGHGHGLYLTRRIVQAHGGSIAAESRPGHGMSITITLPVCQPDACATPGVSPQASGSTPEPRGNV